MRPRISTTAEEMLKMREQGMNNAEIAEKIGCAHVTVIRTIGKQPKELDKHGGGRPRKPVEPQKGPSEPLECEVAQMVEEAYREPQKRQKITMVGLFEFAVTPNWPDHLKQLARLAQAESWQFKNPERASKYPETAILENYLLNTFKSRVSEYNAAETDRDRIFYFRNDCCCFHTGLYTPQFLAIYAYFVPNRVRAQYGPEWYFFGFKTGLDAEMWSVDTLPEHRTLSSGSGGIYDPSKPITVNTQHVLTRADGSSRLPSAVKNYWNASLLLETAVELARRTARITPETVVTASRLNGPVYLLPLYMTNPDTPDLVGMVVPTGDGYYTCKTCLTLNQAYLYARLNGRPSAPWLTQQLA